MDSDLKAQWIEALRSGDYTQGQYCLRRVWQATPDSFCCLGVLADIVDPEGWSLLHWRDTPIHSKLPDKILDFDVQGKLVNLNDIGKDFDEIANWIETSSDF
jgi:hypothetical protein